MRRVPRATEQSRLIFSKLLLSAAHSTTGIVAVRVRPDISRMRTFPCRLATTVRCRSSVRIRARISIKNYNCVTVRLI